MTHRSDSPFWLLLWSTLDKTYSMFDSAVRLSSILCALAIGKMGYTTQHRQLNEGGFVSGELSLGLVDGRGSKSSVYCILLQIGDGTRVGSAI